MNPSRVATATVMVLALGACAFTTTSKPSEGTATKASPIPSVPASVRVHGTIAFRRFTDTSLNSSQIVTAQLDGRQQRAVTHPGPGVQDTLASWSPDGRQLAFMRITGGPKASAEVYVVGRQGGPVSQITHSPAGAVCDESASPDPALQTSSVSCNGDPAWSPDGKVIAYSHFYRKNSVANSDLWLANADGSGSRPLIAHGHLARDSGPTWAPDGTRIAFERSNDSGTGSIFVVNADGTGVRQLTSSRLNFGDHACWSPDGTRILFRTNPGNPTQEFHQSALYFVRPDGTGLTKLTDSGSNLEYLSSSWSPDSRWIVTGLVRRGDHNQQARLYLLSANAHQQRLIVDNPRWQSAPRWAPAPHD